MIVLKEKMTGYREPDGELEKAEGETERKRKWEKVRDANVGRDREKEVRIVCE